MPENVRRGYIPSDQREFSGKQLDKLRQAQRDLVYLLDHGYDLERSTTFIGNRFQFSARQRMALVRATSSTEDVAARRQKELSADDVRGKTLLIDGFNVVIPLEIALSGSTLLHCMDGTVRDLAGLHGTYRLIDKTEEALRLLTEELERLEPEKSVIYLDAPVSNSGRLRQRILEIGEGLPVEVILDPKVDSLLWDREAVATGDAVILNRCRSWVNLTYRILERIFPEYPYVCLTGE